MAYSGSKDWAVTRDDIIGAALRKTGEYDSLDGIPATEQADAELALNAIIKEWMGEGVGLWLRQRSILILNPGLQKYHLGLTGTPGAVDDFHCFRDSELIEATATAADAGGQKVITVDAWVDYAGTSSGVPVSGDVAGIRLDDGTFFWDTVDSATTTSVTLNTNLPSAGRIGSKVYTYTTRISRPAGIVYAYRESTTRTSSQIDIIGRTAYERLSLKNSAGEPTKLMFDPQIIGTTPGDSMAEIAVWPVSPPRTTDKLVMITKHYVDDFDAATDNPQFPIEWANALIWALAWELSFEYGCGLQTRQQLKLVSDEKKFVLMNTADVENADVRFGMDFSGGMRQAGACNA